MIVNREMDTVFGLLHRILDIRVTFFDVQEHELDYFDMKPMSPYCTRRRADPAFLAACVRCDRDQLRQAKRQRDVHIYHCHNRLLEGIVPLYDRRNLYLGSIVFGQLRDPAVPVPADAGREVRRLYGRLPAYSEAEVRDIGHLLKYVSEYIIGNEVIRYRNKPWAEKLEAYIEAHLPENLTLARLAQMIGRSPSFLSHHFPLEFGKSPRSYLLQRRMEEARIMLENGETVQGTAVRLGFYDAFHFSKTFKAYWGRPPKHYKPA
ncbi:MAG: helix-turn-helix domain-containing protein [Kiritimatiellae bacterium]|nr:helix-turn-helix domain-containing protein [Kiritimatiellia bacterium]